MKCQKAWYLTRSDAKKALKRINKNYVTEKELTNVYKCECGYWHLTSLPKQVSRDITRHLNKEL